MLRVKVPYVSFKTHSTGIRHTLNSSFSSNMDCDGSPHFSHNSSWLSCTDILNLTGALRKKM